LIYLSRHGTPAWMHHGPTSRFWRKSWTLFRFQFCSFARAPILCAGIVSGASKTNKAAVHFFLSFPRCLQQNQCQNRTLESDRLHCCLKVTLDLVWRCFPPLFCVASVCSFLFFLGPFLGRRVFACALCGFVNVSVFHSFFDSFFQLSNFSERSFCPCSHLSPFLFLNLGGSPPLIVRTRSLPPRTLFFARLA